MLFGLGNKGKVRREVWREQTCHLMDVDLGFTKDHQAGQGYTHR